MRLRFFALAILAGTFAAAAVAAPRADRLQQRPEALEAVLRCRAIAEEAARLACFDQAVASFERATASREVVVVDRKAVRDTKRSLFGLSLPRLAIFGGGENDDEEVNSIEGVAASAYQDGEGRWVVHLQDGGTWRQIDNIILGGRVKAGSKIVVRRAAMGSFMMRIDGQPGVRARREN
jgi:hypothetical protein